MPQYDLSKFDFSSILGDTTAPSDTAQLFDVGAGSLYDPITGNLFGQDSGQFLRQASEEESRFFSEGIEEGEVSSQSQKYDLSKFDFSGLGKAKSPYDFTSVFGQPTNLPETYADEKYRDLSSRFWAKFKEGVLPFEWGTTDIDEHATTYELIADVAGGLTGVGIGMIPFALMTGTGVGTAAGLTGLGVKGAKAAKTLKTARTLIKAGRLKGASKYLKLETSGILGKTRPYVNTMARLTAINPQLARVVDLGARNFVTFNLYGQAHVPFAPMVERRMQQMKADTISSIVFSTAGLLGTLGIPKPGTLGSKVVDSSALFLAGYGGDLMQTDMDFSERMAHGLGLVAMHQIRAGADRAYTRGRQQSALRTFGYTEKEINRILADDKLLDAVIREGKIEVGQRPLEEQNPFKRKVGKKTENVDLLKIYTNKEGKQMAVYRDRELNVDYTLPANEFFKSFKKVDKTKTILEKEKEAGIIVDDKPIETIPQKGEKGYNTWSRLRGKLKSLQKKQNVSDKDYKFINKKMTGVESSTEMVPSQLATMLDLYRTEKKSKFSYRRLEGDEPGIIGKLSQSWRNTISQLTLPVEATLRGISERYNSPTATKLAKKMAEFTLRKAGIQGHGSYFLNTVLKKKYKLSKEDLNHIVALIDPDKFGKFGLTDNLKKGKFVDEKGVSRNLGKQIVKEYDSFMKQMFTWMAESGVKIKVFKGSKTKQIPIWEAKYKKGGKIVSIEGSDLRYPSTILNKPLKKGSETTLKTGEKVKLTSVQSRAVDEYYPRILTEQARSAFKTDDAFRARVVERIMEKDSEISKIPDPTERQLAAVEKVNEITNYTENRGVFGVQYGRRVELPARMAFDENGREIKLDSFNVKVGDTVNGSKIKKIIDVYERHVDRVIPHYTERVSHAAPTTRIYGAGGVRGEKANDIWTKLSLETKDDSIVNWAKKAVERQVHGHEMTSPGDKVYGAIKHLWGFAANIGLSSPFSGFKNMLIGEREIFSTFNFRAYQKAYHELLSNYGYWRTLTERTGALQMGTHQLQALEASGFKPIEKISFFGAMRPAEVGNRVRAVVTGLFTGRTATDVLVGNKTPWEARMSRAQARHYLENTFRLDVDKILKRGRLTANEETQIMSMAHIMTQGAPELPFVPTWMAHPIAKPATLFYRIAYRVTENVQQNIWRPLAERGNPIPMMKYMSASAGTGALMIGLYSTVLGMEPKKYKDIPDRVFDSMMRAEFLGVFSNAFDEFGGAVESYTPFIFKILNSAKNEVAHIASGSKKPYIATHDWLKENLVIYNHGLRLFENSSKPDFAETKRFKNLVNQFKKDVYDAEYQEFPDVKSERSPYYRLVEQAFWSERPAEEKAHAYKTAYWFIAHSLEREELYTPEHARKLAGSNLMSMVTRTQPVNLSRERKGKKISDYNRFLKSLNATDYNRYQDIYDKWIKRRIEWNKAIGKYGYGDDK